MEVAFVAPEENPQDWLPGLRAALPAARFHLWPQIPDPAAIDAALVAKPPAGSLARFPGLKLIQSLWLGVDGLLADPTPLTYDPLKANLPAVSLDKRKGRYVELEHANAFPLGQSAAGMNDGLFPDTSGDWGGEALAPRTYVMCDVFAVNERKILMNAGNLAVPGVAARMVSPGTPILYYKANPASKILDATAPDASIYNFRDNYPLISLGMLADSLKPLDQRRLHPLKDINYFYEYIRDPRVQARPWPYRPDSYLLISAGADGLYGTKDDICNFGQ